MPSNRGLQRKSNGGGGETEGGGGPNIAKNILFLGNPSQNVPKGEGWPMLSKSTVITDLKILRLLRLLGEFWLSLLYWLLRVSPRILRIKIQRLLV